MFMSEMIKNKSYNELSTERILVANAFSVLTFQKIDDIQGEIRLSRKLTGFHETNDSILINLESIRFSNLITQENLTELRKSSHVSFWDKKHFIYTEVDGFMTQSMQESFSQFTKERKRVFCLAMLKAYICERLDYDHSRTVNATLCFQKLQIAIQTLDMYCSQEHEEAYCKAQIHALKDAAIHLEHKKINGKSYPAGALGRCLHLFLIAEDVEYESQYNRDYDQEFSNRASSPTIDYCGPY